MDDYRHEERTGWFEFGPEALDIWTDISRWARFLAIAGLILFSLLVIGGAFSLIYFLSVEYKDDLVYYNIYRVSFLLIVCSIQLVIIVRLLQFSTRMGRALKESNQVQFQAALLRLRIVFRLLGIMTIVFVIFYLLVFMIKSTL
jgi:amino acid permease